MRVLDCKCIRDEKLKVLMRYRTNKKLGIVLSDEEASIKYFNGIKKVADLLDISFVVGNVYDLNDCDDVMGILALKPYNDEVDKISFKKDIEGYVNNKVLSPVLRSVIDVVSYYNITYNKMVVIGKGRMVGLSIYNYFKGDKVVLCDSKSDLEKELKDADLVISCVGKAFLIKGSYLKDGCVFIDVGTCYVNGKLVGDLDKDSLGNKSISITDVYNGIGILTTVNLFENFIDICRENNV